MSMLEPPQEEEEEDEEMQVDEDKGSGESPHWCYVSTLRPTVELCLCIAGCCKVGCTVETPCRRFFKALMMS